MTTAKASGSLSPNEDKIWKTPSSATGGNDITWTGKPISITAEHVDDKLNVTIKYRYRHYWQGNSSYEPIICACSVNSTKTNVKYLKTGTSNITYTRSNSDWKYNTASYSFNVGRTSGIQNLKIWMGTDYGGRHWSEPWSLEVSYDSTGAIVYVYDNKGNCREGMVYVYDSKGNCHLAENLYVYDSKGVLHSAIS